MISNSDLLLVLKKIRTQNSVGVLGQEQKCILKMHCSFQFEKESWKCTRDVSSDIWISRQITRVRKWHQNSNWSIWMRLLVCWQNIEFLWKMKAIIRCSITLDSLVVVRRLFMSLRCKAESLYERSCTPQKNLLEIRYNHQNWFMTTLLQIKSLEKTDKFQISML